MPVYGGMQKEKANKLEACQPWMVKNSYQLS
jgi:hypothetical protein